MKYAIAAALLLSACGRQDAERRDTAGARLEAAATAAGLVIDPARTTLIGAWARDTDRVCVVARDGGAFGIGARVDYGPGQGCAAAGSATRTRDGVRISFADCRFDARFDGERLVFPAEIPGACDHLCVGRATLAALAVEHISTSPSEAATLRAPDGTELCAN